MDSLVLYQSTMDGGELRVIPVMRRGRAVSQVTVVDLARRTRPEGFLREDLKGGQTKILVEWQDVPSRGSGQDGDGEGPENEVG